MIHIIIGEGKGKTSASVGLSIRAAGHGYSVLFIQFLKDDSSGEIEILKNIPGIKVVHAPISYGFTYQMSEKQLKVTAVEYNRMLDIAAAADVFLVVLDEAIHALNAGLIDKKRLDKLLDKDEEIVLTGREAPDWLIAKADYVSNIQKIKHPFDRGIRARAGIEF